MKTRSLVLSAFWSTGFLTGGLPFPIEAYGSENPVIEESADSGDETSSETLVCPSGEPGLFPYVQPTTNTATTPALEMEISLDVQAGALSYQHTFAGKADEIMAVSWEQVAGDRRFPYVTVTDVDDVAVRSPFYVDETINRAVVESDYFVLPEAGEYTLSVELFAENIESTQELADGEVSTEPNNSSGMTEEATYLLKTRGASSYERLMLSGTTLFEARCYEDAIQTFALAAEQQPEFVAPHLGQLIIYANDAYKVLQEEVPSPEQVSELFNELELQEQSSIVNNLRRVALNLESTRDITAFVELDPQIFTDVANFLETGEISRTLQEMFESVSQ
ncbi:MAG: hypothetical protein WA783_06700 [Phormidesmis sp.]